MGKSNQNRTSKLTLGNKKSFQKFINFDWKLKWRKTRIFFCFFWVKIELLSEISNLISLIKIFKCPKEVLIFFLCRHKRGECCFPCEFYHLLSSYLSNIEQRRSFLQYWVFLFHLKWNIQTNVQNSFHKHSIQHKKIICKILEISFIWYLNFL